MFVRASFYRLGLLPLAILLAIGGSLSSSALAAPRPMAFKAEAPQSSSGEVDSGQKDRERASARAAEERRIDEKAKKEKEEQDTLEHERALERIEAANEEEDKFGPLGCLCLSILLPPLTPVWIILMIMVDAKPVPVGSVEDGLGPVLRHDDPQKEDLAEKRRKRSEVAQAF